MSKKFHKYINDLEESFEQLRSTYESAQVEIKKLKLNIAFLKELCRENNINIPTVDEPIPF